MLTSKRQVLSARSIRAVSIQHPLKSAFGFYCEAFLHWEAFSYYVMPFLYVPNIELSFFGFCYLRNIAYLQNVDISNYTYIQFYTYIQVKHIRVHVKSRFY